MGDVYRAQDLLLDRIVALKTLRSDVSAEGGVRRLLDEARAASALNHPNIAVIYETSEAEHGGQRVAYIAMEYVEGATLATLIQRGAIDVDRALDIAGQIADALGEAHRLGLVHRDIKPSNVMVTPAGRVKVLDFGVAQRRAPAIAAPDDVTRMAGPIGTLAGFVGTLPYVAPEQAAGREVDGRADIFALGVVVYELACGAPPFTGATVAELLQSIQQQDVPSFPRSERDPRLPEIERLVRRMLERDPDRRAASASDVREAITAIRLGRRLPEALEAPHDSRSVAVGGFANISGNPEDDWLGAGISETLTADAGQLEGVSVIARDRMAALLKRLREQTGERDEDLLLRAGREVRARWIVSGGFQRLGDTVRVTASITDVTTGQLTGTAKVDGRLHAIFDLQDRLVRDLAAALRSAVAPATSGQQETNVVEAYEAFSRGLLNRQAETFESLDRAVGLRGGPERTWVIRQERAIPQYTLGHRERIASVMKRIGAFPGLYVAGNAYRGVSVGSLVEDADRVASDDQRHAEHRRALFIGLARFDEAAVWFERALERNAKAGWYALQLAHCAALARDFSRGEQAAARAVELQEAFLSGREGFFIAGSYLRAGHLAALQGRFREALDDFEREIDFLTRTEHTLRHRILVELNARLGSAYLQLGEPRKAQAAFNVALESFDRRVRLGADDPFTRYYAAAVHALRGEAEPAMTGLGLFTAARARIEPEFDRLRGDPRFERLISTFKPQG